VFSAFSENVLSKPRVLRVRPQCRSIQYLLSNQVPVSSSFLNLSSFGNVLKDQKRFKKGRGRKEPTQEETSDNEDEDDEDREENQEVIGGVQDRVVDVASLRLDAVIKGASRWPRNKIDDLFFDKRIRINGERPGKKADNVSLEDEIDLIKGKNRDNPDFLDVYRFIVLDVPDISSSTGRIKLKVRIFSKLTIDNYEKDPYEGSMITPEEEPIRGRK
jgi:hypothetical protein